MKIKKFFLLILFTNFLVAQQFSVNFKFNVNRKNDFSSVKMNFVLHQNNDFSIFELDDFKDINQFKHKELASIVKDRDTFAAYIINDNIIEFFYEEKVFKNFKNNSQINNKLVGMKCQYVKDKIDMFNWEIINEKDTIIANYQCKKAVTKFRGRDYVAYYTNEIANQGGPWKFDGLPGFILHIKSKDNYIFIEPLEIKRYENQNKKVENPFENKKIILFEEVAGKIIEDEKKQVAKQKSKPNPPDKLVCGAVDAIEDVGLNKERVYE